MAETTTDATADEQSLNDAETIEMQPAAGFRKRKKRKKYSKGTKDAQRLERGVTKASYRVANAVTKGLDRFYKEGNKSARKRRNGATVDALENYSKAFADAAAEAAKAPAEIARRVNSRKILKRARRNARAMNPFG